MFHMFDRLLLLCKGQTAYFGNVDRVVDSFQEIGLTMKEHYNPADFICEFSCSISNDAMNLFIFSFYLVEQVKSSSEIREKIIAHAREARKSPSYPAELNSENIFSNYGDLRRLSGLDNILSHAHGVGVTTEKQMIDEEKHLWIDTQSHTSSASSDSHDSDCGLGYPTGFYTQFKVS